MRSQSITRYCSIPECGRRHDSHDLCSMHRWRLKKFGSLDSPRPTPAERFWPKVNNNGPIPEHRPELGPCWLWMASRNPAGYGLFGFDGRCQLASRVVLLLVGRPIPKGLMACHHCDNPPCVNPAHIFVGTNATNAADKKAKGRAAMTDQQRANVRRAAATRDNSWWRLHPEAMIRSVRGEKNGLAKLTDTAVREIRRAWDAKEANGPELARRFGIAPSAAWNVATRKTWKHVQ